MNDEKLFKLIDGIWPYDAAYIEVEIPEEWLTDCGHENTEEGCVRISLAKLLNNHKPSPFCVPTKQHAKTTIKALRRYAAFLENAYVNLPEKQKNQKIFMDTELGEMDLPKSVQRVLMAAGVSSFEEAAAMTDAQWLNTPYCGKRVLGLIRKLCARHKEKF